MGKKCRVCGKDTVWELRAKGEHKRYYCSLTHLLQEIEEAVTSSFHTPDYENKNAKFWR